MTFVMQKIVFVQRSRYYRNMMANAIEPFPLWNDLKNYRFHYLRRDLTAAFSVALMALPQAMAYAFLADLPAMAGIWAAIFGTIFTSAFGQSRFLVSGTTNTIAIVIQSGVAEILYNYYRDVGGDARHTLALNIVLQLVLVVGIFQMIASLLNWGRLTQFVSRSVMVGYMAGAAAAIVVTQLFPFFGIEEIDEFHPIYQKAWYFLTHFFSLDITTTLFALASLGLLIALYKISEAFPGAALVFFIAAVIAAFFPGKISLLRDIGLVPSGLPSFDFPFFEFRILGNLIPLAFAITVLSSLETTTIGKTYTTAKEPPYQDNQEIYGVGISNIFSSFLGAMPSSGSFSRSALNYAAGAKTRLSSIFSGLFVFLFVLFFGSLVSKIPIAAMSALMIFTAYSMVNIKDLTICIKATPGDAFVVIITFLASLFFTLDVVLYIGISLAIALYLKYAALPRLIEFTFNNLGKLRPLISSDERLDPAICIFQAEAELFFAAADPLQLRLRQLAEDENIKVVILQLFNVHYIDASICLALEKVHAYLRSTQRHLLLAGLSIEVHQTLAATGLLKLVGEENCFMINERLPGESTRHAYAYAKTFIV